MTRQVTFSVQTADDAFDLIALVNEHMPGASFMKVSRMLHSSDPETKKKKKKKGGKRISSISDFPNTRQRWTADEDIEIMRHSDDNFADPAIRDEIAEALGRTRQSVESRRWRLKRNAAGKV
jgi:hypothetical protein